MRDAKAKGYSRLWDTKKAKDTHYKNMRDALRKVYTHLGKTEHYYFEEPFHSLRHIGAHYWLERTEYNHSFVAEIGGWKTIDELQVSYGKIPPSVVIKKIKSANSEINES